jgi:hypothetical protein
MGAADNLKNIIDQQKTVLSALEAEHLALAGSNLAQENAALKADIAKLLEEHEMVSRKADSLNEENAGLKNALYEQIYNEKIKIVNNTAQKLDIYFRANLDEEVNRLTALEKSVKARIKKMRETLTQNNIDIQDGLYAKLDELSTLLDSRVTEASAAAERLSAAFSQEEREELEALKNEQISDDQILAVTKKNNLERFLGLNVLNAGGILLLILGVITLARYTYVLLPDLLKGIMMFSFGGAMLVAGEFLNRKKPNIFSLGLSAGGVGILYAALATSYFILHILDMYPALAICILITLVAFVLANRYNSQIIISFALIGGYLPMFSLGYGEAVLYGAMAYFVALNLLALLVSFSKKWRISSFIGLFLNIIGTTYICFFLAGTGSLTEKILITIYALFAFLVYTAIPITSAYCTKSIFKKSDIVLLAINTVCSSLILFGLFSRFQWQDLQGLLAIAFAAIYLLLGRFAEKKFTGKALYTRALFYLTGLTFVVLIIPFQFGRAWLSLGWLAEGVFLAAYGILGNNKTFKRVGFIICLLCLAAFILHDIDYSDEAIFPWKYLAITLGSLVILGAYMQQRMMSGRFISIYKYFALINVWFYTIYIISIELYDALFWHYYHRQMSFNLSYLIGALTVTATFVIAYIIPRIKLLASRGLKIVSVLLYAIGILIMFILNTFESPVNYTGSGAIALTIGVLTLLGLLSVFAMRDLMRIIIAGRKLGVEWYPLGVSAYFVILLTQILITQFDLAFSSAAISIIYALTALAWIIFGFMRRYAFIRHFGLGLVIFSVFKLFFVDLYALTQGRQIVSYFSLGLTLLVISFVYQYFSKRLELKEVISLDAKEAD